MHRIRDLLRHHPATGAPWLVRLDVRVKLCCALAMILAVVLASKPWLPLGVLAFSTVCWIAAREPLGKAVLSMAAPTALAGAAAMLKIFLTGTTPLGSFSLCGLTLTATREGMAGGLLTAARVVGSVSVILILCRTTATHEIFSAMRWAKAPQSVVEIAVLMFRHLGTFLEHAVNIQSAQRLRLGYSTLRRTLQSAGSLSGMVILRSLDQAQRTHEAMTARGYDGTLHLAPLPSLRGRDAAILAFALILIGAAWRLAERWPA